MDGNRDITNIVDIISERYRADKELIYSDAEVLLCEMVEKEIAEWRE